MIALFLSWLAACANPSATSLQQAELADFDASSIDLNGIWGYSHLAPAVNESGNIDVFFPARDGSISNFEKDFAVLERADDNLPLYHPKYWEQIRKLDYEGVADDPIFNCRPAGVPRMGAPQQIVQTDTTLVLLYAGLADTFRVIHVDGRPLSDMQTNDFSWKGYSVGEWHDGVLYIETKGFNNTSWLGWFGWIHSKDMVVREQMWREDDVLKWVATVDDPMLLEPWTTHVTQHKLNSDPHAFLWETPPCEELDREHMIEDTRG